MPDINYVHPKLKNIINKDISIQLSLNGFSFLVKSSESGECLVFRNFQFSNIKLIDELVRKTEQIISKESLLLEKYNSATAYYINQKATLVPQEYFKIDELKKYFEFNQNLGEYDELNYNHIDKISAYTVFSLPNYLSNAFYNIIPNIQFKHQSATLIKLGVVQDNKYHVTTGINANFFDVAIFENNSLLLYNSYEYTNPQDFIYFFLYPLHQLRIDPSEVAVSIVGEEGKNKAIIQELKQSIQSITYPKSTVSCSKTINEITKLSSYSLFY